MSCSDLYWFFYLVSGSLMSRPQSAPSRRPLVATTPRPPSVARCQTTDGLAEMQLPQKARVIVRNAAARTHNSKVFETDTSFRGYVVPPALHEDQPVDETHHAYFCSLITSLETQQSAFSSFSVCCEHA